MTDIELIHNTRQYAIENHKNTYGDKPYVFHLDAVYDLAVKFDLPIEYKIAAYLHDLIEDTTVTKDDLTSKFGEHIATMVFCVSGFGNNRSERKQNMKEKMLDYPASIDLKMIDRLSNMMQSKKDNPKLYEMYCKEHEDLKEVFSKGNPTIFEAIENLMMNNTPVLSTKKNKL